jgi:hypothetical protein
MKPGSNKARKLASQRLGLALQANYRALVEANGQEEIQAAAIALGDTFNTNIEFIINVLKAFGGMEVKFEPLTKRLAELPAPANDLPDISALVNVPVKVDCLCPPLEHGIIGNKHMTSCPHFVPAPSIEHGFGNPDRRRL